MCFLKRDKEILIVPPVYSAMFVLVLFDIAFLTVPVLLYTLAYIVYRTVTGKILTSTVIKMV